MSTTSVIEGTVYVLGDNIDTDQIIPAEYLNLVPTIPAEYRELGSHAMAGLPDGREPLVPPGALESPHAIVIAGRNFGCGSSREHAPIALGAAGVRAVVAESYARIFFRNAVATGEVYPLECVERLCDVFETGQRARIDLERNTLERPADGTRAMLSPLGAVRPVVEAGGIFGYARSTGMIPGREAG
mgnify:CR=1 FL=1